MSTARQLRYTYEEYLSALAMTQVKLEYCDGEIYAMAGGTAAHADRAAQMIHQLKLALPSSCRVFGSDLKVRIEATDLSTFPDVSAVCGDLVKSSIDRQSLTNPTLVVEVTSPSTEAYDRSEKLRHYKHLTSLRAVIFVSHRRPQITLVERSATGWDEREFNAGETVLLRDPAIRFPVDAVYSGVARDQA
jgi:Uma2 family endonuclease